MTSLLQNLRADVANARLPLWRSHAMSEQLPGQAGASAPGVAHNRSNRRTSGAPSVPPPAYNRSPGLPLSRTISSGRTLINPQKSCTVQIEWVQHPALRGGWWAWTYRWLYFLRFDKEWLNHKVPEEFKQLFEESAGLETRDKRKAMEVFEQRVGHLNRWIIPDMLCLTRFWMVMLLIVDVSIVAYFIFAMVYTQAQQGPILQVAEVALILMIFLTGGIINHIRMRRWHLHALLRGLSRDWSPNAPAPYRPLQQRTPGDILRAYIAADGNWANVETALMPLQEFDDDSKPKFQWYMSSREGTILASYRPVIRVELLIPSLIVPAPPVTRTETNPRISRRVERQQEDYVPKYTATGVDGETTMAITPVAILEDRRQYIED